MSATGEGRAEWRLEGPHGETCVHAHNPRYVADDLVTLQYGALGGVGASLLPDYMCRAEIEAGRLSRVLPGWGPSPVVAHMVFPARRALVPAVRRLIDFLVEHLQNEELRMF
jgi:DNA-binding transcriptional LysR family regulator